MRACEWRLSQHEFGWLESKEIDLCKETREVSTELARFSKLGLNRTPGSFVLTVEISSAVATTIQRRLIR